MPKINLKSRVIEVDGNATSVNFLDRNTGRKLTEEQKKIRIQQILVDVSNTVRQIKESEQGST